MIKGQGKNTTNNFRRRNLLIINIETKIRLLKNTHIYWRDDE